MKKSATLLWFALIVLGALIMIATVHQNISGVISLSEESSNLTSSIPLDLNTATAEDLMYIPGIGEDLAKKIIAHRRKNGPFESVQELLQIKGIGPRTYDKISEYLTVGG